MADVGVQSSRIELTEDDLRQMSAAWLAPGRPPLTPEKMQRLAEQRAREEILYREALALGLDRNDTIVRSMAVRVELPAGCGPRAFAAIGPRSHRADTNGAREGRT
jgi:hypothetical protein